jgi:hypothetical protein
VAYTSSAASSLFSVATPISCDSIEDENYASLS